MITTLLLIFYALISLSMWIVTSELKLTVAVRWLLIFLWPLAGVLLGLFAIFAFLLLSR